MENKFINVRKYIKNSWIKAVKQKDCIQGFSLPYDYIPPCVAGDLINLYYWDTYFTNVGLYLDGFDNYAYNNIEVLKYCLNKFGCVPNMCRETGAKYSSQPPLLFLMVKDYFEHTKDIKFLEDSYNCLKKEYDFWMTKRISENGLNRYGFNWDFRNNGTNIDYYVERLGVDISSWSNDQIAELCENLTAESESGEDFTPRFFKKAKYVNPIDLNSYLFGFENAMATFSAILNKNEEEFWNNQAKNRKKLLDKYCLDKDTGLYFDYDFRENKISKIYCVACYLPFIFGLLDDNKSLQRVNNKLINKYGVTSCEEVENQKNVFQWGYPNAWAPHQFWAYVANKKLNNVEFAKNIALTYMTNVSNTFEKENKLYEKYDAVLGGKALVNEYGLPEMLGWTAGVYNYFYNELKE